MIGRCLDKTRPQPPPPDRAFEAIQALYIQSSRTTQESKQVILFQKEINLILFGLGSSSFPWGALGGALVGSYDLPVIFVQYVRPRAELPF